MIDEPIHPYIKYGKIDDSPLVKILYELINENGIEFRTSSLIFEDFVHSDRIELIELFMHLKKYIRDNKGKYTKALLFINKHGLRIEPED